MEEEETSLSQEQIADYTEMFTIFDRDEDGKINIHEMELLINAIGFYPQENELEEYCNKIDPSGDFKFDLNDFIKVASHFDAQVNLEEILTGCLKTYAGDEERIRDSKLFVYLTTLGNPLTPEEVKHLRYNAFPNGEDEVEISDFVQMLLKNRPNSK
ncbi:calmodulin [Histomonas meleagridis]|uniref:calmodulin n=1 Tax=Histomonas meleagridis TaxID=135588 RepID=UPI00355A402D|nr:calmodulin [Histomonas meleagridis]KAH0798925.1 calmodulin [Histomonas meleagridis]